MSFRRTDAPLVIHNQVDRLPHVIGDSDQFEVVGIDEPVVPDRSFYPLDQPFPVFTAEEDQGKTGNTPGLHQRDDFKKLVERAEPAGHEYEPDAVFHEADFTRKEIMKMNGDVGVAIGLLLERQLDVQPHRFPPGRRGAFVGRFHDTGTAARNDGEVVLGQAAAQFDGRLVTGIRARSSRRAEYGDRRTDLGKGFKRINELGHDTKNAPRIFPGEPERMIVHARNIDTAEASDKRREAPAPFSARSSRRELDGAGCRSCAAEPGGPGLLSAPWRNHTARRGGPRSGARFTTTRRGEVPRWFLPTRKL